MLNTACLFGLLSLNESGHLRVSRLLPRPHLLLRQASGHVHVVGVPLGAVFLLLCQLQQPRKVARPETKRLVSKKEQLHDIIIYRMLEPWTCGLEGSMHGWVGAAFFGTSAADTALLGTTSIQVLAESALLGTSFCGQCAGQRF